MYVGMAGYTQHLQTWVVRESMYTGIVSTRAGDDADEVIKEDDEIEDGDDASRDLLGYDSEGSSRNELLDSITRKTTRNQKRDTMIVTSGALTFILLAASLVTISFLLSPVIEQIFGKGSHSIKFDLRKDIHKDEHFFPAR